MIGFKHMMGCYIASGIGGNLFSSLCTPNERSIGASTADFGIFTGLLAMIFVNWSAFDGSQALQQMRCMQIAIIVIMIFLNFAMTSGAKNSVDVAGHGGGSIVGLLWGLAFFPRVKSPSGVKLGFCGKITLALFIVFCLLMFYLNTDPTCDVKYDTCIPSSD